MTFSTPLAQQAVNQMPGQFTITSLSNRPGRLITVVIFSFLATVLITVGLSLLVFHVQYEDNSYLYDGVWGGITTLFIFGFAFLAAAVTIAGTSSDNPHFLRYLPDASGAVGGHSRGLFEKPAFLSLVVAFGIVGTAMVISAGFSRLVFPAFIDRGMDIDNDYYYELWPGIWIIMGFGIACFAVAIIIISTSNRPQFVPFGYYPAQFPPSPPTQPAGMAPPVGYPAAAQAPVEPPRQSASSTVSTEQPVLDNSDDSATNADEINSNQHSTL